MSHGENDFSWNDDQSVIIKRTEAIAVYSNAGDMVIRQQEIGYGDTTTIK